LAALARRVREGAAATYQIDTSQWPHLAASAETLDAVASGHAPVVLLDLLTSGAERRVK
jgi:hypothetical protein